MLSMSESGVGGYKEVIAIIEGERVYSQMKWESGVHRVQRVPRHRDPGPRPHLCHHRRRSARSRGRGREDRSQGPPHRYLLLLGSRRPVGQYHLLAVRITHLPTGTVVSCQDEKSQIKNRDKGMRVLRSRLYDLEMGKQQAELAKERKSQVGTGDRSEKIRTYNFPQNRLTDHRIGLTLHQLDLVMEGRLQPIVDALVTHYQAEQLKADSSQAA